MTISTYDRAKVNCLKPILSKGINTSRLSHGIDDSLRPPVRFRLETMTLSENVSDVYCIWEKPLEDKGKER